MNRKIMNYLKIIILFVTVFAFTSVSYAWMSRVYNPVESTVTLNTTETPPLEFVMWTFLTEKEAAGNTANAHASDNNGTWIKVTDLGMQDEIGDFQYEMPSAMPEAASGVTAYSFDVRNLQLGSINNLHKERNDNILYMQFHICPATVKTLNGSDIMYDPNTNGHVLQFTASQPRENYCQIYDMNGRKLTDADTVTINKVQGVKVISSIENLNRQSPFMRFEYCISSNNYAPSEETFSSLKFVTIPDITTDTTGLTYGFLNKDTELSDYYLYIKISPNLSTYGTSTKYLYNVVPCTMLFDWKFEIEVQ